MRLSFQSLSGSRPSRRGARLWVLAVGCSLLAAPQAEAFPYAAKEGDTLASIAERFYGRVEMEKILVAANGFDEQVPMVAGMRIDIPAVSYHTIKKGDSWASLAREHLGGERRAEALALSNDVMPWVPPKIGREIIIPFPLRYEVDRGDTTPGLSYRFLGKRDDAYVIDRFNDLGGEPIAPGDVLLIPVGDLVLTDEGKEAAKASAELLFGQSRGDDRDAQLEADLALSELRTGVREGRYLASAVGLARLRGGGSLSDEQRGSIARLELEAYAALGETKLAEDACLEWRRHDPEASLDPVLLSPKLLRACSRAAGTALVGPIGQDPPGSASSMPSASPPSGDSP